MSTQLDPDIHYSSVWRIPGLMLDAKPDDFAGEWITQPSANLWDSGKQLWWVASKQDPYDPTLEVIPAPAGPLQQTRDAIFETRQVTATVVDLEAANQVPTIPLPAVMELERFWFGEELFILWTSPEIILDREGRDSAFYFVSHQEVENPLAAWEMSAYHDQFEPSAVARAYVLHHPQFADTFWGVYPQKPPISHCFLPPTVRYPPLVPASSFPVPGADLPTQDPRKGVLQLVLSDLHAWLLGMWRGNHLWLIRDIRDSSNQPYFYTAISNEDIMPGLLPEYVWVHQGAEKHRAEVVPTVDALKRTVTRLQPNHISRVIGLTNDSETELHYDLWWSQQANDAIVGEQMLLVFVDSSNDDANPCHVLTIDLDPRIPTEQHHSIVVAHYSQPQVLREIIPVIHEVDQVLPPATITFDETYSRTQLLNRYIPAGHPLHTNPRRPTPRFGDEFYWN